MNEIEPRGAGEVLIRNMVLEDIPAGLRLCRASGWNQVESDWSLFLELSPEGCRVAETNGEVVGTVATLPYEDRFSWLAMVLVHPEQRRAGLGTRLLHEGLNLLRNESCTRLDATAAGRQIYQRYGFVDEYPISRVTASVDAIEMVAPTGQVRRMRGQDFAAVFDQDRAIFGADREPVLQSLFARSPECAWVSTTPEVRGYCFGRPGFLFHQLGPIVAAEESIGRDLVSHCVSTASGRRFGIDAPQHCGSWLGWLKSIGFVEERSFMRMRRGENRYPGQPQSVFGVAGPEFG